MSKAEEIVRALADWSNKYPRQKIYNYQRGNEIDKELIAIEEMAKEYVSTPQEVSEEDIEKALESRSQLEDHIKNLAEKIFPLSDWHSGNIIYKDIISAMVDMYKAALLNKQNDVTSDNATSGNFCDAPFKDNKSIQQLMGAAYCTGCGHKANEPLGVNKIGERFLACCPDSNYVVSLSLAKSLLNSNQQ